MIYFGIENNIVPQVGKFYVFKHRDNENNTFLHIGECIPNSNDRGYKWAMLDVNDKKVYYPYCLDVLDISQPLMSALWERSKEKYKEN